MKLYFVLTCAVLAAAMASGQKNGPRPIPEPTDIQGIPTAPPPSSLPKRTQPPIVPPSAPSPFKQPSGVVVPDRAPPSMQPKVVINYWEVVRDMMKRVQNAPPRPGRVATRPGELRADYPFEEFRNMRATDLIRAAREGALAARREKAGRPPLEIDRQVWENVALALEYLPLVARDEGDVRALARIIESREEDIQFRRFVLANLEPDQKDPSLLSMFLNDAYARFPGPFNDALNLAAGHPMENPEFQTESMRVYYDRLLKRYRDTFAADPKIAALAKQTGKPVDSASLLGPNPPALDKASREKVLGRGRAIGDFGKLIAAHIEPNSVSAEKVKTETRKILEQILAQVKVPDRDTLLHCLDPSHPLPASPEGMPPMPVMADTGDEESIIPIQPGSEIGLPGAPQTVQLNQPPPTPVPLPAGL